MEITEGTPRARGPFILTASHEELQALYAHLNVCSSHELSTAYSDELAYQLHEVGFDIFRAIADVLEDDVPDESPTEEHACVKPWSARWNPSSALTRPTAGYRV